MNDVVINKIQTVQRSVKRAREEFEAAGDGFKTDHSRQDAAVMNIVRACESTIDLANHLIRKHQFGIPNSSSDSFRLLAQECVIDTELAERLAKMVGFRNIAVHAYQALNYDIVMSVLQQGLDDLLECCELLRVYVK